MKKFVFMESSWRDRNECEVGEDGFDMMSFRSSLSLLCRDQIGGRPEGMWVDQLRYYWNNLPKGDGNLEQRRWRELDAILEKWTRLIGRLVMEGEWKRECPGWFLGSEVVQQDGWWRHLLGIKAWYERALWFVHLMHEAGPGDIGLHFRIDSIIMSSIVHVKRPRMGFLGPTPS